MTERVDLKDFLSAYLAEVEEHLQVANTKLLEIENALRDGKPHPRAVRDLFRSLHTVKGLSAMVGVEPVVAIAHRMETALRAADSSGGKLTDGAVDTLLRSIRAIEQRVRELAEHKEPSPAPAPILAALDDLDAGAPVGQAAESAHLDLDEAIASKLAPFEVALLLDGARGGRRAVRIDFSPSPAKAERGLSINSVRERIGTLGDIIKVVPCAVTASAEAPGGLSFALLVLATASVEELAAAAGVRPEAVRPLVAVQLAEVPELPPLAPLDVADDGEPLFTRRDMVRVEVTRLDDAMDHLSTLIVTRSRLARAVAELTAAGVSTRELSEIMRENSRQLRDLRGAILRVRMIPVSEVLDRLPLLLRGLSRDSGRQVHLELDGGTAEFDKSVAERLFPSLVHLVRNAVDHAIESPEERRAAGKPERGTLRITCSARSNARLELTVSDDGRGIDRQAVARRSGVEILTDDALLDTLCRAGFSTRDIATTTSGRGMGMDIVRRTVVDQLGGELSMTTEVGVGTTFVLQVPVTISIVDAFVTECRGQRFVVPVAMVEEILELDPGAITHGPTPGVRGNGAGLLERRGETVPLVDLGAVLQLPDRETTARRAMLVRRGGEPVAFAIDKVTSQQEAVVRPLVDALVQVPGVSGATDLGDGRPTVVLDLVALSASLARRERGRAA